MRRRSAVPVGRWTSCVLLFGALATLPLVGCKGLTDVEAPDVRAPEDFATAAGASALGIGAMTRFATDFDDAAQNAGMMADELYWASNGGGIEWDRRDPLEPSQFNGGHYAGILLARINLLTATAAFQRTAPDSMARMGQLFALTGFAETLIGETFCAGVPLSRLDAQYNPVYGPPLTGLELYEHARATFDSALVYAVDSTRILYLAAVGKGRALLNLGRFAEAAQAVAIVPTSYVYQVNYVTGTRTGNNDFFGTGTQRNFTVPEQEGGNGINWRTAADPRVTLVNPGLGLDGVTPVWQFSRYQTSTAPIPLATGIEARLIEAEAALQANDAGTWLTLHNTLRTTVPGLDPLVDPGTPEARRDLHFRERAFWLFLTAHRQGDLRRLVRQYGLDAEAVFPTGIWKNGMSYGGATNMALPAEESPNPHFVGCLDRAA